MLPTFLCLDCRAVHRYLMVEDVKCPIKSNHYTLWSPNILYILSKDLANYHPQILDMPYSINTQI